MIKKRYQKETKKIISFLLISTLSDCYLDKNNLQESQLLRAPPGQGYERTAYLYYFKT